MEVILIGEAKKIDFKQDIVEKTVQKAQNFPYETKTSFQRDYEKGNNRHEGDIFGDNYSVWRKSMEYAFPQFQKCMGL